jgi:FAD/FMN-containing dehydrogenase
VSVSAHDDVESGLDGLSGSLLRPGDEGYDDVRQVYNGMIDRRPAVIVRCRGTADAVAAVNAARRSGLEIAVRGGGHGVAGHCTCDEGMMIDLSEMRGVHVDPLARTGRAEPGVTWAGLNRETQLHGLAVTGGTISTTGIGGLTLGGGFGWLMSKYGLAADNLLSAEVVTADGRVLTANDQEHPDLYWALRGGGGNFGIVTSFEYRLHPVGPTITGGLIAHPLEAGRSLGRFYRDFTSDLPDDLGVLFGLVHAPDGSGVKLAALVVCHGGDEQQALRDLAPALEWGEPAIVQVGPMPYQAMNQMLDAAYPKGSLNYWKSSFLESLSDDFIDTAIERFEACPSSTTAMVLEHFHGAATRVPVEATACPHRLPGYNLLITSVWSDAAADDANIRWTRETMEALAPDLGTRSYLNYMAEDDAGDSRTRQAFGANYERLANIKRVYDPDNLFHRNQNIRPAG